MKRLSLLIVFSFPFFLCIPAFGGQMPVFVSILPQKYFLEKIGGPYVSVSVMVAPGANPATYEPLPSQMAAVARARAYFAIGVPFEAAWLPRIRAANPELAIIHTDHGIEKKPINRDQKRLAARRGIFDPHIWLSPRLVAVQARTIADSLVKLDPAHGPEYKARLDAFIHEIKKTDAKISKLLAHVHRPAVFMVFHPCWGYFADDFGLRQVAVEKEGKSPKPEALKKLIEFAKNRKIRAILVQPQFPVRTAKIIASAIHGKIIFADPLAYDWTDNLLKVSRAIAGAAR